MSGGDATEVAAPQAAAPSPAGRAARAAASAAPLSEYELERLEKIKRNSAALAALNLPVLSPAKPPPKQRQRRARPASTEAPRRSSRVAAAPRESMADPGDNDSFGKGGGFSSSEDAQASDEDAPRRKRAKKSIVLVIGFPEARPGAGIVAPPEAAAAAAGAAPRSQAPSAKAIAAAPAPPVPPLTEAGTRTTTGKLRKTDGLQARFGHVMQAGAPTLHAHELAELRHIITQPPYYSPVKLAELLDRVRQYALENSGETRYANGKFVAEHFKVSKIVANAVVRFLSRARVLNTSPSLADALARAGNNRPLCAAALAAEAAIASGKLLRPVVSAAEATPLPPNVFVTTGRSARLVHNAAGYKGVRRVHGESYVAELFDGPTRYRLGTFRTAQQAAEAYDRAVISVRAVTTASQLNFPLERYAAAKKEEQPAAAAVPAVPAAPQPPPPPPHAPLPGDDDPFAAPTVTLAEAAGA